MLRVEDLESQQRKAAQRRQCKERSLTDVADRKTANMPKKGCIRHEGGDEDKSQEWSGPRRYPICANASTKVSSSKFKEGPKWAHAK